MYKDIILSYLIQYLNLKKIPYKKGKVKMVKCPICNTEPISANIIPNIYKINCFKCKKKYDLIDVARKVDSLEGSEEEILQYLKDLLKINVTTKIDEDGINKYLDYYEKNKWALIPLSKNSKYPLAKFKWKDEEYRNKNQWNDWIKEGLNIALRTGKVSNVTILDFDILNNEEKKEFRFGNISQERKTELLNKRKKGLELIYNKFGDILGNPLVQENLGGEHLIYKYEKDLKKTFITIEDIHIDIENDGGYVLIEPSKLGITARTFKELKDISKMPEELKNLILSKTGKSTKTYSEIIAEDIKTENFKIDPSEFNLKNNNLEGCCNSSFIKLGGILRKELSLTQTAYVLNIFNHHLLENPMPDKDIRAMVNEINHYIKFDEEEFANKVLNYLKEVEVSTKSDLELYLAGKFTAGEPKKTLNKIIQYLINEDKIIQRGNKIELIKALDWSGDLLNVGVPVNFKVPYFYNWAYFNWDDLIIIGSRTKFGKTTLAMNVVKRLIEQGINPDYIYNESGGRFAKTALKLGIKPDEFNHAFCTDPDKVILRKNKVTIFDWVKPKEFARSVDKDTPILIKNCHGIIEFIPINDLSTYHKFKNTYVYTLKGWTNLQKVIKHKCDRKMYRIITKTSIIECSEDHSLIINNKKISPKELTIGDKLEIIEPELINCTNIDLEWSWFHGLISAEGHVPRYYKQKDRKNKKISKFTLVNNDKQLLIRASKALLKFGINSDINLYKSNKKTYVLRLKGQSERFSEQLSQWHINKDGTKKIPHFILSSSLESKKYYLEGYIAGDGNLCPDKTFRFGTIDKTLFTGLCYILKCLNYNFTIGCSLPKSKNHHILYTAKTNLGLKAVLKRPNNMIKDIQIFNSKEYIYDLQTKDHTFNGGVGDLINLHNTDNLFAGLVEKVKKAHGFLICFVQLRDNNGWFAPDQIGQFPALVSKYVYTDDKGVNTKFEFYARDAKIKGKEFEIPCLYDWETKEVKTAEEIQKEKKDEK